MFNGGFVEPSSDVRQGAKQIRELFVALTNEGFTPKQAMELVCAMIQGATTQPPQ